MIIGTAKKPRVFRKRTGQELGFDYHNNKKAWMKADLFREWLLRFNEWIKEGSSERKVALLIDNCSAHGGKETIPELSNVTVIYFHPNTTSKLQPLDAGIIAAVKTRYRKSQLERVLDMIDIGDTSDNIYKVDQLTAMRTVKSIWEQLPSKIILNCWRHTGLLKKFSSSNRSGREDVTDAESVAALQSTLSELLPRSRNMDIASFLNPEEEDDCIQHDTEDELLQEALIEFYPDGENTSAPQAECPRIPLPAYQDQLKAIVLVKHIVQRDGASVTDFLCCLKRMQREIRQKTANAKKQSRITSFFDNQPRHEEQ